MAVQIQIGMTNKPSTNRLRVLRAERRITQMDLSVKARVSMFRYWRIENGYIQPTDEELKALARALKVTAADIFPAGEQAIA